jgi:hypothetical protein
VSEKKPDPGGIKESLRRFRKYGRPKSGPDQVHEHGPSDHDGNPRDPSEDERGNDPEEDTSDDQS